MWLFIALVAVPIIEIALFIHLGGLIGTWETIALVILTAIIGSVLLRHQGLQALRSVQGRLMEGENPGRLLADGAMILVAGALLLTPGFLTDAVGFLLLVPPVRALLWGWLSSRIKVVPVGQAAGGAEARRPGPAAGGETIDGSYEDVTPDEGRANEQTPWKPPR